MISQGTVTGRAVGGPSTNLGLELLLDEDADHDEYGYISRTSDGRELHSSSVYFRNAAGRIIAAFCVNVDLTPVQQAQAAISQLVPQADPAEESRELIAPDIATLLDDMIAQAFTTIGKPPTSMTKTDRIDVMRMLDARGAFQVKRSVDLVARRMGVSRVTAYNYLDEVHG